MIYSYERISYSTYLSKIIFHNNNMKQIVVTGHNGFLGSNLLLKLISEKYDITGISKTIKKNNLIKIGRASCRERV